MSGAQGPVQILSTLVNGSFEWEFGEGAVWAGDAVANPGPSKLLKGRLRLVSKTFTGNVFLDGWDVHLRRNRAGTVGEFN